MKGTGATVPSRIVRVWTSFLFLKDRFAPVGLRFVDFKGLPLGKVYIQPEA